MHTYELSFVHTTPPPKLTTKKKKKIQSYLSICPFHTFPFVYTSPFANSNLSPIKPPKFPPRQSTEVSPPLGSSLPRSNPPTNKTKSFQVCTYYVIFFCHFYVFARYFFDCILLLVYAPLLVFCLFSAMFSSAFCLYVFLFGKLVYLLDN